MTFSRVADVEQASPIMLANYVRFRAMREAEKDQLEKGRVDGKIVGYLLEKSISTAPFSLVSASGILYQFFWLKLSSTIVSMRPIGDAFMAVNDFFWAGFFVEIAS